MRAYLRLIAYRRKTDSRIECLKDVRCDDTDDVAAAFNDAWVAMFHGDWVVVVELLGEQEFIVAMIEKHERERAGYGIE